MDDAAIPPGETHSVAWLKVHGYVLDRTGIWVDALLLRAIDAHEDAVRQALVWREEQRGLPARRPHQHPLFI